MYWKEIPVQVQAEDGAQVVSVPLDDRFQRGVDAVAMLDGNAGGDDYLMAWEWGEYSNADGRRRRRGGPGDPLQLPFP